MTSMLQIYAPNSLVRQTPLTRHQIQFIEESKATCNNILTGKDSRIAIVVGPCSIHNYESALEYAIRLKQLSASVSDCFYLIMRVYVEKPRTTLGWKGLLYDPFLDGSDDLAHGIALSRRLLTQLAEMQIPTATEFVNPLSAYYLSDLVSWGFIGARTSSSQPHRELVSSLDMPVGFKNTTEGNYHLAINGAVAARSPQTFLGVDGEGRISQIKSLGNPHTHIVLRGSEEGINYDPKSIQAAAALQDSCGLNTRLMIDCAHGNSKKKTHLQKFIFKKIIQEIAEGNPHIFGVMLESFLEEGNQPFRLGITPATNISITDPCLDWESTESLILEMNAYYLSTFTHMMCCQESTSFPSLSIKSTL